MLSRIRKWREKKAIEKALCSYLYSKSEYYEWLKRMPVNHPKRLDVLDRERRNMHVQWNKLVELIPARDGIAYRVFESDGRHFYLNYTRKSAIEKRIYEVS